MREEVAVALSSRGVHVPPMRVGERCLGERGAGLRIVKLVADGPANSVFGPGRSIGLEFVRSYR